MTHKFSIEKAKLLDDPERRKVLNPEKILRAIGLEQDMSIADIGCGTGYFSIPASKKVKMVYALDIQDEMLDILKKKVRKEGIKNIEPVLSEEASFPLPGNSVDIVLMANVFHEFEDRGAILREAKRILKKDGKLAIVDWKKEEMKIGPPLNERLSQDEVAEIVRDGGFEIKRVGDAGTCNYMVVAVL